MPAWGLAQELALVTVTELLLAVPLSAVPLVGVGVLPAASELEWVRGLELGTVGKGERRIIGQRPTEKMLAIGKQETLFSVGI